MKYWSRGRIAAGRVIRLSPSQRAVLRAIAHMDGGVEHPGSHRFLSALRLPTSTGNQAREVLEREDLIRQEDDGRWTLVDPVVSAYLRRLEGRLRRRSSTPGRLQRAGR